jgi:integrase
MNLANSLEGMPLSKITRGVLSEYEHGRRAAGIQSPTIIRDLATLSVLFEVAIGAEWLEANPVKPYLKFAKSHGLTENEPRRRYLSLEEERSLLRACIEIPKHDEETRRGLCLVISLSISTGLRIDELVRLPWRDVDLDRNQITVRGIRAKSKKTRLVPILPPARKILDALPSNPHSIFVLCRKDGRRLKDMYHPLKNVAAFAKIEDVTIHDLRRTCGVRLLRGIGVPRKLSMQEVSTWLGHSSVKVTERHYAFLEIDQLHDAVGTAVQISEQASGLSAITVDLIDESPADPSDL